MNLDDVLHGKEADEESVTPDEGQTIPTETAPEPQGEVKTAPPAVDISSELNAFKKAALDEREKRQKLERQLEEFQRKSQPEEKRKSFYEDPDEYINRLRQEVKNEMLGNRLDTFEALARSRHQDYQEKIDKFNDMVKNIPGLREQCFAQSDPAEFAYQQAKYRMEFEAVGGSVDSYRQKIEDEIRAKIKAEVEVEAKKKEEEKAKLKATLPHSISETNSSNPRAAPTFQGPTPLNTILKRKK